MSKLSLEICKQYETLVKAIRSVSSGYRNIKIIQGTSGVVSVNDLIAYQIGWGSLLIGWYEAGVAGQHPMMPGEGFTTWDYVGLALHFYQKYSFGTDKEYDHCFHDTVTRILKIVDVEHLAGNLDAVGVWSWCTLKSGKPWPLSKWIRVNTVAPYKKAAQLIRARQEGECA